MAIVSASYITIARRALHHITLDYYSGNIVATMDVCGRGSDTSGLLEDGCRHVRSSTTHPSHFKGDRLLIDSQYKYEIVRIETFSDWPVSFLEPKVMAATGFYYLRREDIVRCAFCGVEIGQWVTGDDPVIDHEKWSPNCAFLKHPNDVGNVPLDDLKLNISVSQAAKCEMRKMGIFKTTRPRFSRYATLEARLKSFNTWPISIPTKGEVLSRVGFFYTGKGDCTNCFHCGISLRHWLPQDDPWFEHAKYSPECTYLLLHKGQLFVDKVDSSYINIDRSYVNIDHDQAGESITPATSPPLLSSCDTTDDDCETNTHNSADTRTCKICYASDLQVAVLPCAHLVSCIDCVLRLDVCIICREEITATIRIYM